MHVLTYLHHNFSNNSNDMSAVDTSQVYAHLKLPPITYSTTFLTD